MAKPKLYVIALSDPRAPHGAFVQRSTFPVPDLGTLCVCCDEDDAEPVAYDPSGDRQRAGAIDVPVCEECEEHVWRSNYAENIAIVFGSVGVVCLVGFAICTLIDFVYAFSLVCAIVPIAISAGLFTFMSRRTERMVANGHHPITMNVAPGITIVKTTNARVAEEVLTNNTSAKKLPSSA